MFLRDLNRIKHKRTIIRERIISKTQGTKYRFAIDIPTASLVNAYPEALDNAML